MSVKSISKLWRFILICTGFSCWLILSGGWSTPSWAKSAKRARKTKRHARVASRPTLTTPSLKATKIKFTGKQTNSAFKPALVSLQQELKDSLQPLTRLTDPRKLAKAWDLNAFIPLLVKNKADAKPFTLKQIPWRAHYQEIQEIEEILDRLSIKEIGDLVSAESEPLAVLKERHLDSEQQTLLQNLQERLGGLQKEGSKAAYLLSARIHRYLGEYAEALVALHKLTRDPLLASLAMYEAGLVALEVAEWSLAEDYLAFIYTNSLFQGSFLHKQTIYPFALALAYGDPRTLLEKLPEFLDRLTANAHLNNFDDSEKRSKLLGIKIIALTNLGLKADVAATTVERYLAEPLATSTPSLLPPDLETHLQPGEVELLRRANILLNNNFNEQALAAYKQINTAELLPQDKCLKDYNIGLAQRKLHQYENAAKQFAEVIAKCEKIDGEVVRKARYLQARVVAIKSGLAALPYIENFVTIYKDHSMVDDLLFLAGDMYQRRKFFAEALMYYQRVINLTKPDDKCADALWRIAWLAYKERNYPKAVDILQNIMLKQTTCALNSNDQLRANYWLGRIAEKTSDPKQAIMHFKNILLSNPLSFYALLALTRLQENDPAEAEIMQRVFTLPVQEKSLTTLLSEYPLFVGNLVSNVNFLASLGYLGHGLTREAGLAFSLLNNANICAANQADSCNLALTILLDQTKFYKSSTWKMKSEFNELFTHPPFESELIFWYLAYPPAFREFIDKAERDYGLPSYLLQALAREESVFDPKAVSWAGAYGLTQLLLSTAQNCLKLKETPLKKSPTSTLEKSLEITLPANLTDAKKLFSPALSAHLGGGLLGKLLKRYDQSLSLALAGYNAGEPTVDPWWAQVKMISATEPLPIDEFIEDIPIEETRNYVSRVLKTYGVYLWLYTGRAPFFPAELTLPVDRQIGQEATK